MDSLTQALLGAATFSAVMDKDLGWKGIALGAAVGTIPDLDVFLSPFYSRIESLTVHRGFSHSIFFHIPLSFLLGWLLNKWFRGKFGFWRWTAASFAALFTHALLDACTTYGTQLLHPFSRRLFAFDSIFVVEPIYTLFLLSGVLLYLFYRKRKNILLVALVLSTGYMGWAFVSKSMAGQQLTKAMQTFRPDVHSIRIVPTPLNTLMWHGVGLTENGACVGTYSLLDGDRTPDIYFVPSDNALLPLLSKDPEGAILLHFAQGYAIIQEEGDDTFRINILKFGPANYNGEPKFLFPARFSVENGVVQNLRIEEGEGRSKMYSYADQLWTRMLGKP